MLNREELINKILEFFEEEDQKKEMAELSEHFNDKELLEILEMLKESVVINDIDEEEEIENSEEKENLDPEKYGQLLACQEEEIRQHVLYEEEYEVEKEVSNSKLYIDMMTMAQCVTASVREMVSGGIDYPNAMTLCNNFLQNQFNLELAKHNQVQSDKNQI